MEERVWTTANRTITIPYVIKVLLVVLFIFFFISATLYFLLNVLPNSPVGFYKARQSVLQTRSRPQPGMKCRLFRKSPIISQKGYRPPWLRIDPIPPKTAATKALIPGIAPAYGVSVGYAEQRRSPTIAARPEPMAKVSEIVALHSRPITELASLSSGNCLHGASGLGLRTNQVRATIMTTLTTIVTIVIPLMTSCPSNRVTDGTSITVTKLLASAPKIRSQILQR